MTFLWNKKRQKLNYISNQSGPGWQWSNAGVLAAWWWVQRCSKWGRWIHIDHHCHRYAGTLPIDKGYQLSLSWLYICKLWTFRVPSSSSVVASSLPSSQCSSNVSPDLTSEIKSYGSDLVFVNRRLIMLIKCLTENLQAKCLFMLIPGDRGWRWEGERRAGRSLLAFDLHQKLNLLAFGLWLWSWSLGLWS